MNKPLPKIKKIIWELEAPLSKQHIQYRSYNVGDEKLLLAAAQAKETNPAFYANNTLAVLNDVVLNDVNIELLPSQDVGLLMINLRGRSVGEELVFSFEENEKKITATLMTTDFFIKEYEEHVDKIQIDENLWVQMKPITFRKEIEYSIKYNKPEERTGAIFDAIIDSVDKIYTEEDVWVVGTDIQRKEVEELINSVSGDGSKGLYQYISTRPKLAVEASLDTGEKRVFTSDEIDFLSSLSATRR